MSVEIREATDDERPEVERLLVRGYEQFAGVGGAVSQEDVDALYVHGAGRVILLARSGGGATGCVAYFPPATVRSPNVDLDELIPPDHAYLGWLAVLPSDRRRGLGEALTAECVSRARAHGASAIQLMTAAFMSDAQRLYERMGFVRLGADAPPGQLRYALDL